MTAYINDQTIEGMLRHRSQTTDITSTATSNSTLTLSVSSTKVQIFTGSTVGQIIKLPNATTLLPGHIFWIFNNSTVQISFQYNDGSNTTIIPPGKSTEVLLTDNSTSPGIWIQGFMSASPFSGTITVGCSYTASAGVGRYLQFYPPNPSDAGPFLLVSNARLVGLSVVSSANSTGTASIFKTSDLVNSIASISLAAQNKNSDTSLLVSLLAGESLAVRITSGSIQKPGVGLYLAN